MRLLITGLSSFIGKKLLKKLGDDIEILSIGRKEFYTSRKNIFFIHFEDKDIEHKIRSFKPDVFLNIASDSRSKFKEIQDYREVASFNIAVSSFLVDIAIKSGVNLIVNISSNWGYIDNLISPKFFNYYGFTKFALDKYIQNACFESNCISISLVLYDNFDKYDPRKKIFNLILESIENNIEKDFSPGKQIKNLTRIDDIVQAIKFSICNNWKIKNHAYYQVTGFEISILELSNEISNYLNKSNACIKFGGLPYRDGEIMKPKYFFEELPYIGERKDDFRNLLKKEIFR